ncbi:hypothetical protein F5Y12DRAFT_133584 [Xylaria sp. FL1777]|nr:hypothetical protein F5Y12DRAFT_133584 [Xylaria sp. FL1777]
MPRRLELPLIESQPEFFPNSRLWNCSRVAFSKQTDRHPDKHHSQPVRNVPNPVAAQSPYIASEMPREGTRSATGNSRPRVFQAVDTAPAIKRTTKPKAKKPAAEPSVKPVKPAGVTKKKTAPKKDGAVAKVKAATKKVEAKAKKVAPKPKAAPATAVAK